MTIPVVGQDYYLTDHSNNIGIKDGKLKPLSGYLPTYEPHIVTVLAYCGLVLPTASTMDRYPVEINIRYPVPLNNTIVRRHSDNSIMFTQAMYLVEIKKP